MTYGPVTRNGILSALALLCADDSCDTDTMADLLNATDPDAMIASLSGILLHLIGVSTNFDDAVAFTLWNLDRIDDITTDDTAPVLRLAPPLSE